jgi:hypothetical protein
MVETHLLPDSATSRLIDGAEPPSDRQKQEFSAMLAERIAQGYAVESQSDTEAVLVTRGRRRRFRSSVAGKRQRISIDEQGRLRTRGL